MDLLKKTINKLALQKMTHSKAVTSPPRWRHGGTRSSLSLYFKGATLHRSAGASNGDALPIKLKSSQVAAIASKQPKQGPVVLPRPHMKVVALTFCCCCNNGLMCNVSMMVAECEPYWHVVDHRWRNS